MTDKSATRHGHVSKNGFSVDGSRKGSDPLPPGWVDRPSKPVYEPPEYVPRRPAQPYIPLNPYRDQSSPPVVPSGSVDVHKAVAPNGFDQKDPNGRRKKPIVKFPTGPNNAAPPPPSWHPSYPNTETGFIPIEPFFHSNSFINRNKHAFNNSHKSKNESKKLDGESSGTNVRYFSSTTLPPRTHSNFVHHHTNTVTTSTSSTSSTTSTNSAKKTGAEAGKRPFNTFNSPTDSTPADNSSKGKYGTSSASSSSSDSEEYNEEEVSKYTPVDTQTPEQEASEEKNKNPTDDLSLTDFWDIFTGQPIRNKNTNPDPPKPPKRDPPHYYDEQLDSPVNFSNPIDATTYRSVLPTPDPFSPEDASNEPSITGYDNGVIRRATGKPTITKIIEQGFYSVPNSTSGGTGTGNGYAGPDDPISNELDGPVKPADGPSPSPLVPPVVIGSKSSDAADWYYTNYHNAESGAGTEEWEKLIERSRINQLEEELVGAKRSSSRSIHSSSLFSSSSFPSYHYCLASLLYYLLVYRNP